MVATHAKASSRGYPIVYKRPSPTRSGAGTTLAWLLFLVLGLPFLLMAVLEVLARAGIYVDLFRPLWQPWPPDLVKPFLGLAVFAATLGLLAFRAGHRRGFRAGVGVGLFATRASGGTRATPSPGPSETDTPPPPPPPAEPPESPT